MVSMPFGLANNVVGTVGGVANSGINIAQANVANITQGLAGTAQSLGNNVQNLGSNLGNNAEKLGSNLGNNLEKTGTSLFQSPVLLIGGIIALMVFLNKQ